MPTPQGNIAVRAERQAGRLVLQVGLPSGVSAQVRLPARPEARISFSVAPLSYAFSGEQVVVELTAGATTSIEVEEL